MSIPPTEQKVIAALRQLKDDVYRAPALLAIEPTGSIGFAMRETVDSIELLAKELEIAAKRRARAAAKEGRP